MASNISDMRNIRLLYIGDVPVESTYHGSNALFRLLRNHAADSLLVIEGGMRRSRADRRLPGVRYHAIWSGWARPLRTRLSRVAQLAYFLMARRPQVKLQRLAENFRPEAILTVTHETLWMPAAALAEKLGLPLYLICHDDWPQFVRVPEFSRRWLAKRFGEAYRQAAARFCVCAPMAAEYRLRYGVDGVVLLPSRAPDVVEFAKPPSRPAAADGALAVGYAGNLFIRNYFELLGALAGALRRINGRVIIFGPVTREELRANGILAENVEVRGMVDDLIQCLREEVDVLFVPMSFAAADRYFSEFSFPSKLTDCTAPGVPLLVQGPAYSSVVKWCEENAGVAEIVTQREPGAIDEALQRLQLPGRRLALARRSLEVGRDAFAHSRAERVFYSTLAQSQRN